ncbi:MAG TPA: hypothetical protein VGD59_00025 [Acidisarcina sp.]
MRTTLSIDDDALKIAKQYAAANGSGLGKAVSELVKRAVAPPLKMRPLKSGFFVYDLRYGKPVTSQMVKDLQDETE